MLKKFQTKFLILISALALFGCANGVRLNEQNVALNELIAVAQASLPAGKRKVSQNGREFFSNYFVRAKDGEFIENAGAATRYYSHITILGDRRPYDLDIEVFIEKRAPDGQYDHFGYDEGLARVISRRIEKSLYQRREDRNNIDDFKVF